MAPEYAEIRKNTRVRRFCSRFEARSEYAYAYIYLRLISIRRNECYWFRICVPASDAYSESDPQRVDCVLRTLSKSGPVRRTLVSGFVHADNQLWLDILDAKPLLEMIWEMSRDCPASAKQGNDLAAKGRHLPVRIESRVVAIMQSDDENK